jgi:hypothetical protein
MRVEKGKNAFRCRIRERERERERERGNLQAGLFWFSGSLCFSPPLTSTLSQFGRGKIKFHRSVELS